MTNEIITPFLHGIGFAVLWFIGMFIIPIAVTLIIGKFTNFDNDNMKLYFGITFILYWILSALLLILI